MLHLERVDKLLNLLLLNKLHITPLHLLKIPYQLQPLMYLPRLLRILLEPRHAQHLQLIDAFADKRQLVVDLGEDLLFFEELHYLKEFGHVYLEEDLFH